MEVSEIGRAAREPVIERCRWSSFDAKRARGGGVGLSTAPCDVLSVTAAQVPPFTGDQGAHNLGSTSGMEVSEIGRRACEPVIERCRWSSFDAKSACGGGAGLSIAPCDVLSVAAAGTAVFGLSRPHRRALGQAIPNGG